MGILVLKEDTKEGGWQLEVNEGNFCVQESRLCFMEEVASE